MVRLFLKGREGKGSKQASGLHLTLGSTFIHGEGTSCHPCVWLAKCLQGKMGHGGLDGWKWEGVASEILQEAVTNTEFLGNRVEENSLCGSV